MMETFLQENWLLLLPVLLLLLAFQVSALVNLIRRERVTGGKKWVWALIILISNPLGPLAYFVFGRKD